MEEADPSIRRAGITSCFKEMLHRDNQELVLILSGLWHIAMTHTDDPEYPSLGIFNLLSNLIMKGISDKDWLLRDQNIYVPYYAAHIIGSYTMNKAEFAEKAVESGVIPPLIKLLRGKLSWVEQRVAVRALGHLASYETTFKAVLAYEQEVVDSAMQIASTCLEVVYSQFIALNGMKRSKYQRDLLTRGIGRTELEDRKAEEWASQLQCWSLYLLNCFACKGRSLDLICRGEFLKDLCEMWGGLVNHSNPGGVGLIRILCYTKIGRERIADCKEVVQYLCNLSRSSDDWQYMGIDCLLLLLRDQNTRYQVIEIAIFCLIDLIELNNLGKARIHIGEAISRTLLQDHSKMIRSKFKDNPKVQEALDELWILKVEKGKRERLLTQEKVKEKRVLVDLIKQQAKSMFWAGHIEEAMLKYNEALEICPLRLRKDRMVIYSNRGQCHLLLGDADSAIRDTTRALCLSSPANNHCKSLWRRSQAYDMKGLSRESLMDCLMFVNGCMRSEKKRGKHAKIPHYAARMISKQMEAMWLFAGSRSRAMASCAEGGRF
ncbi:uncharacterized protein LOC104449279 [Eucalyptus grandis]|uniref:uncharacterized protein LOC104449279 n=1 Tax=Eucalyptus grandis TaxID=71139 RepID=UPI00192EAE30|nr:uncharacterized protein LOC104449279 [Eucalyptus grandis]